MTYQQTAALLQEHLDRSRFHQLFKPEVIRLDTELMTLAVKVKQNTTLERQPDTGQWHGGAIAALVDIVGCYVLTIITPEPLPTMNFRTDFLRPAIGTDLVAEARIRQAGRTVGVVDVDINSENRKLIAVGRGTYSMSPFSLEKQITPPSGTPAYD